MTHRQLSVTDWQYAIVPASPAAESGWRTEVAPDFPGVVLVFLARAQSLF
jgi:hypothetical protein